MASVERIGHVSPPSSSIFRSLFSNAFNRVSSVVLEMKQGHEIALRRMNDRNAYARFNLTTTMDDGDGGG